MLFSAAANGRTHAGKTPLCIIEEMVALTRLTGGAPRCEPRNSPGDEGRLWRSSKPLQSRTQIARAHAVGWRRTATLRALRAQGGRVAMGSRSRSENHLVQHSVGNSESTRSSSTNHLLEERRGGEIRNSKVCVRKCPKSIISFVYFIFPHYEIWVQGGVPLLLL